MKSDGGGETPKLHVGTVFKAVEKVVTEKIVKEEKKQG